MKIAQRMDEGNSHFLHDEYCHFDGNHKRVKSFVTLTARVYHPLLKKQMILATMTCKHEHSNNIELFWRLFNKCYKEANEIDNKFSPCGWCTDMATANFTGLSLIYGEDILDKVKGCEFHYKQSVGKRVKQLGGDLGQEFEKYAYELLYATTPEAYEHAFGTLESFIRSSATLSQQQDWLDWWSNRKQYIFRAFTSFDAPQSNLSEVVHAGWKHRDRTGVSLLECCYFDIRDSLLTNVHLEELESGCYDAGRGPSQKDRNIKKLNRTIDTAAQLGKDILDFTIASPSISGTKQQLREDVEGCNPPKKKINNQKLFQARLDTAKLLELTIKIKNIDKVNKLNRKFIITSSLAGRTTYTIQITNTPSCTCPDFQKNGSRVHCKHLLFVLIFVLLVHDGSDILTSRFIGDDDVTLLLQHDHVDDKYILPKRPAATRRKVSNLQDILKQHPHYNNSQSFTLHHKTKRSAKCYGRNCQIIFIVGALCFRVERALTVLYSKSDAVEQLF